LVFIRAFMPAPLKGSGQIVIF